MTPKPESLAAVIDKIAAGAGDQEVTVRDILTHLDRRAFGPLLLVPALLNVGPTGLIPGVNLTMALLIILISGQMVLGRASPWLPKRLLEVSILERDEMVDWKDAELFADRAVVAAQGTRVAPSRPENWFIGTPPIVNELKDARVSLVDALNTGGIVNHPSLAAVAQAKYDCWVEQEQEGWQTEHIAACREAFRVALSNLTGAMARVDTAPVTMPEEPATEAIDPVMAAAEVHFPFDKATITDQAHAVLNGVADTIGAWEGPDPDVMVIGHADRAGPMAYNRDLSAHRAAAVVEQLDLRGIDGATVEDINMEARGETDPAVPTGDGVRERANRRVVIWIVPSANEMATMKP